MISSDCPRGLKLLALWPNQTLQSLRILGLAAPHGIPQHMNQTAAEQVADWEGLTPKGSRPHPYVRSPGSLAPPPDGLIDMAGDLTAILGLLAAGSGMAFGKYPRAISTLDAHVPE